MRSIFTSVLLAAAMLSAACGGGDQVANEPDQPQARPTPPEAPDEQSQQTSTPDPTPTQESVEAQPLTTVLDGPPTDRGWLLPAGTWLTTALDEPIRFTTDRALVLERAVDGAVWLRDPDDSVGRTWLIIAALAFANSGEAGSPEQPVPRTSEEITAELESNPMSDLVTLGSVDVPSGTADWWEWVSVDEAGMTSFPCLDGRCLSPGTTIGGEMIPAVIGEPLRVYQMSTDETRIGVWVTGAPDFYGPLVEVAEATVPTIEVEGTTMDDGPRWLGPPGAELTPASYQAIAGSTLVELEVDSRIDTAVIDRADSGIVGFQSDSGFFAVVEPTHLGTAETVAAIDAGTPLDGATLAELDLADVEAVEAWIGSTGDIIDSSETTIAGFTGTAYDVEPIVTTPVLCQSRCAPVKVLSFGHWVQLPSWGVRIITLPEADVFIHIESRPGHTVDDVLDEMAPVLDALTLTPVD